MRDLPVRSPSPLLQSPFPSKCVRAVSPSSCLRPLADQTSARDQACFHVSLLHFKAFYQEEHLQNASQLLILLPGLIYEITQRSLSLFVFCFTSGDGGRRGDRVSFGSYASRGLISWADSCVDSAGHVVCSRFSASTRRYSVRAQPYVVDSKIRGYLHRPVLVDTFVGWGRVNDGAVD